MAAADASARSLVRGAGLMLPATLAGYALLLGVDVVANHLLSLEDYGLYGNIRRLVQIAGFVVLLGMENAVIRVVARAPDAPAARAGVWTGLWSSAAGGLVAGLALFFAAPSIAAEVDPSPDTVLAIRIAAAALPLWSIRTITVAACQGWGSLLPRALVTFIAWPIVQLGGLVLGAKLLGLGALGAVAGYAAAVALGAVQGLWHLWRMRRGVPGLTAGEGPGEGALFAMLAVAWPLWVHGVGMALYTWADQLALGGLLGERAAGLYGPVAQLSPLFGVGLGALNNAFAPVIARKHHEGDRAGLAWMYRVVTRWAVVIATPAVMLALVVPRSVLAPWHHVGPETVEALRITAVAQLICTGVGSVNYLLLMSGRPRDPLYNAIPAVLVSLGACYVLIPRYGVAGAALANALAMVLANLLGLAQVWRHLHMHPVDRGLLRPLFASLPLVGLALFCQAFLGDGWATLLIAGGLGSLAFLGVLTMLKLDEGDRMVLDWVRSKLPFRRGGA